MRIVLTPSRHGVPLKPGERVPTQEERLASVAEGRARMTRELLRRFPMAKVVGIAGKGEIVVELPDDPALLQRIKTALDCESGPDPGAPPSGPVWNATPPSAEAVAQAYRERDYRPTVVAVVRDLDGRFLFVQSIHDADEWMLVQGGIDEGELPVEALARELAEETGLHPEDWTSRGYVGCADLDAELGRKDKRGFTKGKRYFVFEVAYRGTRPIRLQAEELADHAWVGPEFGDPEMLARLAKVRSAKCHLIVGAILRVLP